MLKLILTSLILLTAGFAHAEVDCSAECWYLNPNYNQAWLVSSPHTWGDSKSALAALREQCQSPNELMIPAGAEVSSEESETWVHWGWYGWRLEIESSSGVKLNLQKATATNSCVALPAGQAGAGTTSLIVD